MKLQNAKSRKNSQEFSKHVVSVVSKELNEKLDRLIGKVKIESSMRYRQITSDFGGWPVSKDLGMRLIDDVAS